MHDKGGSKNIKIGAESQPGTFKCILVPSVKIEAPKSTKNYYSNNRQNKNLLFDRFCRLFDFVDYEYLSNNRQKNGTLYLWSCLNKLISSANRQ